MRTISIMNQNNEQKVSKILKKKLQKLVVQKNYKN